MQDVSDFKCPFISKNEIWDRAEDFRTQYWPEITLPIDTEKVVEKRLKLNIEPLPGLFAELGIDAFLRTDLTGIVVDQESFLDDKFANRLRFSFAHELGHFYLHPETYRGLEISTVLEWKAYMTNIPEKEYRFLEYQANEFAGRLLVPSDRLIEDLDICVNQIISSDLKEYLAKDPEAVLSRISPALCKPFGVSYAVIEKRVEREGLWPPKTEQ